MSTIQETIDFCLIVYLKTFRYHAFENTYVKSIKQLVKLGKWHGDVFKYFWMPIFTFRHFRRLRLGSTSFQFIFASSFLFIFTGQSRLWSSSFQFIFATSFQFIFATSFQFILASKGYDPPPSSSFSPVKVTIPLLPVHFRQSRLRSTFQLTFTSQGYDPPPSSSFSPVKVTFHLLPVHLRLPGLQTTSFLVIFTGQCYDPRSLPVIISSQGLPSLSGPLQIWWETSRTLCLVKMIFRYLRLNITHLKGPDT